MDEYTDPFADDSALAIVDPGEDERGFEIALPKEADELRHALNVRQTEFVYGIAFQGLKPSKSYELAYHTTNPRTASTQAGKLMANPDIARLIQLIKDALFEVGMLTAKEKRHILAQQARAKLDDVVDADTGDLKEGSGHLIKDYRITYTKDGEKQVTIKLHDPQKAIQIDNAMAGDNAPEEHNHKIDIGEVLTRVRPTTGLPSKMKQANAKVIGPDDP